MSANVLIGCGGSGIRALIRLNALLAEDPHWRNRIASDIYYVILDTDAKDIKAFHDAIAAQMGHASRPYIKAIRLAQNRTHLQPMVKDSFIAPFADGDRDDAKRRLYEHWWHDADGEPFVAPRVRPLYEGAGQCPPVSYFLTWHDLQHIEGEFEDLLKREIPARQAGEGRSPLHELRLCVVAGLAGGTGRGSWALLAFKIREMLLEIDRHAPRPVAFLFDSTTYPNVHRSYPNQEAPMGTNALTGISELSAWFGNVSAAGQSELTYLLPNMKSPGRPSTDILNADLSEDVAAGQPSDNAYLIFGTSRVGVLEHSNHYQEMVGSAIYAILTRATIRSARINEHAPYLGLSAVTYEIEAVRLRHYFEAMYRVKALREMFTTDDDAVERSRAKFLDRTTLDIGLTTQDRSSFIPQPDGNFLQRVCHELLSVRALGFSSLDTALQDDDPDEVKLCISALLTPKVSAVEDAFERTVAELKIDPEAVAKDECVKLLKATNSVRNVQRFLEEIQAAFESIGEELPDEEHMQVDPKEHPLHLVDELKGREYVVIGRRFNEEECDTIRLRTREATLYAHYSAIADLLAKHLERWGERLGAWVTNANLLDQRATRLRSKLRSELRRELGASSTNEEDLFRLLFCDASTPEAAIPDEFNMSKFYRRIIKPILKPTDVMGLLPPFALAPDVRSIVEDVVLQDRLDGASPHHLSSITRKLSKAMETAVQLPLRFVHEKFSLPNVVEQLRQAWLKRFAQVQGDQDTLERLIRKFEMFFGAAPKHDDGEWELPERDGFLADMGKSLAAACHPFWNLRRGGQFAGPELQHRVALFFPVSSKEYDLDAAQKHIKAALDQAETEVECIANEVAENDLGLSRGNPFIMIAYSVEGTRDLNQIASLDYYKTDPRLYEMLNLCEDPKAPALFDQTQTHNGLGYTDPIFVTDPKLSRARWKPWLDPLQARVEQDTTDEAMVYALAAWPDTLAPRLEAMGWRVPLIINKGQQIFVFDRRALHLRGGKPEVDTSSPWDARERLGQGIRSVDAVLGGRVEGEPELNRQGRSWRSRMIQEARLFWGPIATKLGLGEGSDARIELWAYLEKHFDALALNADHDDDKTVWKRLTAYCRTRAKS